MENALTPTDLAAKADISVPYASQIIGNKRRPSRKLAIRIYRKVGVKLPPIDKLSDDDIDAIERIEGVAA